MKIRKIILAMTFIICSVLVCYLFSKTKTTSENHNTIVHTAETAVSKKIEPLKRNKKNLMLQKARFREVLKNVANRPPAPEENEYQGETNYDTEKLQEMIRVMDESGPHYWERASATFETVLDSQKTDFNWTTDITAQVIETLDVKESEGTEFDSVDCRETLCRITLFHQDIDSHDAYYNGPFRLGDWVNKSANSYGERQTLADGSLTSTVYFSKQDQGEAFHNIRKQIIADVNEESENQVKAEEKQPDSSGDFGS